MRGKRWPRRQTVPRTAARAGRRTILLLLAALLLAGAAAATLSFRSLVTELAVSSAQDAVVTAVNDIVKDIMREGAFSETPLVTLERDGRGSIAAVTTNVAAVNALAAEILGRAQARTAEDVVTVGIPLGNLAGSTLLLGKGPSIPVRVTMLSSSVAGFRSELTTAGINQTRHQILLELDVDVSLLMPWRTVGTVVSTELLVSETVIVGDVPESYLNWENEG